jgi:hypothetical protein
MNEFESLFDIPDPQPSFGTDPRSTADLAADLTAARRNGAVSPTRANVRARKRVAIAAATLVVAGTLAATGVRTDLPSSVWGFAVLLPAGGAAAMFLQAISMRRRSQSIWLLVPMLTTVFVVSALFADRPATGHEAHTHCIAVVASWCLAMSVLVLASLRYAFSNGAWARAALIALSIGVLSGSLARTFCEYDAASHVLLAHGGPALLAIAVLALFRRRLVA